MRRAHTILRTRPVVAPQRLTPAFLKPSARGWPLFASRSFAVKAPEDLRFTKSHEWVRVNDGVATVGITAHAQDALGEVVFVDLPDVGASYTQKESFAAVESVKTVSDIYAPVAGEVVEVNEELKDKEKVSAINTDPYGSGWMIKLKLAKQSEVDNLLDPKTYEEHCASEAH